MKERHGRFKDEYVLSLYDRHLKGESLGDIARSLSRDPSTISKLFSKRGLKTLKKDDRYNNKYSKYTVNSDYFKNIDSHEKAYWLGFIMADGSIIERSINSKHLTIGVQLRDKELLNKFLINLDCNKPIYECKNHKTNSFNCKIEICDLNICNDLINLGVHPNKTNIDFKLPNISKEYYNSFIYGYFDGDGTIYKYRNASKSEYYGISICSPTIKILEDIQNVLKENNIYSRISTDRRSLRGNFMDMHNLCITRQNETLKMIHFMTKDFNNGLNRKLEKINHANTVLTDKLKNNQ